MKTIDAFIILWKNRDWATQSEDSHLRHFIQSIQSDAFHAGKLAGLEEARVVIRDYGTDIGMTDKDYSAPPPESNQPTNEKDSK